jgi:hypothetical protein
MIISMGVTKAIQNSRTLAQKFASKNPHGIVFTNVYLILVTMIISMGLAMAIQNSRTLAEKFVTKNPHIRSFMHHLVYFLRDYIENLHGRVEMTLPPMARSTAGSGTRTITYRESLPAPRRPSRRVLPGGRRANWGFAG